MMPENKTFYSEGYLTESSRLVHRSTTRYSFCWEQIYFVIQDSEKSSIATRNGLVRAGPVKLPTECLISDNQVWRRIVKGMYG